MAWWRPWRRFWPRGLCRYWLAWTWPGTWASTITPPYLLPPYPPIPKETEIQLLENYKRFLEEELKRIETRLKQLKSETPPGS